MNTLLLRIWAGVFVSIIIVSVFVFMMLTHYYGSFFAYPDWYPISSTALLVQKIINETPPDKIESEREILSQLLERPIQVYSAGEETLPETVKKLHADDKPVYVPSENGHNFFYAPVHKNKFIVAVDPSFNLYAPLFNLANHVWQFMWDLVVTVAGAFFLFRSINRRLNELEAAAEKIHQGDFSVRIKTSSSDLIGSVETCFNQMANRIQTMISAQQTLLSGFVGKLRTANHQMTDHLNDFSDRLSLSGKAILAEKISVILEQLEQFVGNLLRKEKNSVHAIVSKSDESPAFDSGIGGNELVHGKTNERPRSLFSFFSRTSIGFKSSVFQAGVFKFFMRMCIWILLILMSSHLFGISYSQIGYKYVHGISNWYSARIIPILIQHTVDTAENPNTTLLNDLQQSLRREIKLVDPQSLPHLGEYLAITGGNRIKYGPYGEKNVYFAPVRGGTQTLIIDDALDLCRVRPSPLLHLAQLPIELLLTIICSILLSWPVIRHLKAFEKGLNNIQRLDFESRMKIPAGKPIGNMARSFNDMAERMQFLITNRKHLIQAVGHEIRTPVYRIHFHLEMMLHDEDMDMAMRRIHNICEEIEELKGLAEELQTFTEIENWRHESEEISIHKELSDIVDYYQKTLLHLPITLSGKPDESATIHVRSVYFRRAIQNVVSNAIRYARTNISIRYGIIKSDAFVEICDDGPGVPLHAREAIFEPFSRLDDSRNRKTGGHGLGLAITQRILSLYSGSITISDNIPRGAKFTILWPLHHPFRESDTE